MYELAKTLGVTDTILNKPPSAELWFDQTDEGELGFAYKDVDEILSLLYDECSTPGVANTEALFFNLVNRYNYDSD